ncbi:MAG TPA: ABC transporter permease [Gemmatimonadaceae bacterium]|nr:ABC transporter permease [Gemmatimonadaceae bacterium]
MNGELLYVVRRIRRDWQLSAAVIVTVALGLGLGLTALSGADELLFRGPAGVPRPGQIKRIYLNYSSKPGAPYEHGTQASIPDYADLHDATREVAAVAAYTQRELPGRFPERFERLNTELVSANYFRTLGSKPAIGRLFGADEAASSQGIVGVISDRLWRRMYGASPRAIGQSLVLNGRSVVIVGVAQRGFRGLGAFAPDIWIPLSHAQDVVGPGLNIASRDNALLMLFARLESRDAELRFLPAARSVVARMEANDPLRYWRRQITLGEVTDPEIPTQRTERDAMVAACVALGVTLIVLVTLASASLFVASTAARRRELLTRLALGASPSRTAMLVIGHVAALMLIGGMAAGVLAAIAGQNLPLPVSDKSAAAFSGRFLALGLSCAVLSAAVAGLLPVVSMLGSRSLAGLRDTAVAPDPFWARFNGAVVVIGVAGSVVLLCEMGLFARSLYRVTDVDLGFTPDRLIVASASVMPTNGEPTDLGRMPEESYAFYSQGIQRLRSTPGVVAASVGAADPYRRMTMGQVFPSTGGTGGQPTFVMSDGVGLDYFSTLGMPIVRGRAFQPADHLDVAEAAVINEELARQLWGRGANDVVGKCLNVSTGAEMKCLRIVGVVHGARVMSVKEKAPAMYYVPIGPASYQPDMTVFVRVSSAGGPNVRTVERLLRSVRGDIPKIDVQTMSGVIAPQLRTWRDGTVLFGAAGALTVIVAALSLYALLSYVVARRTPEFGIRLALGASPRRLVAVVMRQGLTLAAIGLAVGLTAALAIARLLQPLLYRVPYTDAVVYVTTALVLTVVCLAAVALPANRAAGTDPATALRAE